MRSCLCLFVAFSVAPVSSGYAQGVRDLVWQVRTDGALVLVNPTDSPIAFHDYALTSEFGLLEPSGWRSIHDVAVTDALAVIAGLGAGALSFREAGPLPSHNQLSELNRAGEGVLQPGQEWSFGNPFRATLPEIGQAALAGTLCVTMEDGGNLFHPPIESLGVSGVCPEPSTLVLAALTSICLCCLKLRGTRVVHRVP